jgi:hypothetical protein
MNNLTAIEPRELYLEPSSMRGSLAVAKHMAETAALMRRWPEMEAAIDILIERQQTVVAWWDEHVRSQGEARKKAPDPRFLSVEDAEQAVGIGHQQVARFRVALADIDAYRARLIARVMRAVDPPDPAARRPTPNRDGPDFWPTPASLITALIDHVLPLLPPATIWECAAGDGRVADAMARAKREVIASDLNPQDDSTPRDFLRDPPPRLGMLVITNPPYNASDAFMQRGLSLLDAGEITGLALLLRHDHLQAGTRVGAFNRAAHEVHCNWRPIWIDGTEGQPRWSFHWIVWSDQDRQPPLYLQESRGDA